MQKGNIVLITFPFSDLSGNKLRPALVLAETANDITAIFITSQLKSPNYLDIPLSPSPTNGIKKPSVLRTSNIATLDKSLVKGLLGFLDTNTLKHVDNSLISYVQLQ